jgi:hypothetical protein
MPRGGYLNILTTVVDIPCERSQFLTQHHLGTALKDEGRVPSIIDDIIRGLIILPYSMTDTHMPHDKNKCDPRHHSVCHAECNGVRPNCACQKNPQTVP